MNRTIILLFFLVYFLSVVGITYAYMDFSAKDNSAIGQGGCSIINYEAQEINASDLRSTTDYKEGAKTVVTLSKDGDCDIYTLASIYIHTDIEKTTAPIEEYPAMKYKVFNEEELLSEGTISDVDDVILATVPLTPDPIDYTIYLWIDSDLSNGEYNATAYLGYIYATSHQTSTVNGFLVRDLSYNTNNAIAYGANWDRDNGIVTTDGIDDYIDCGLANYDFGDHISMIIRIQFNEITGNALDFFGNYQVGGGGFVITRANYLAVEYYIDGSYRLAKSSGTVSTNTWYTLIATYNGSMINFYVNGVLTDSLEISGNIRISSMPFYIGGNAENNNEIINLANITVSDALIFDRALSESEIISDYSNGINPINKDGLLFYYDFT